MEHEKHLRSNQKLYSYLKDNTVAQHMPHRNSPTLNLMQQLYSPMCWKTIRSDYTVLINMKFWCHPHCHYSEYQCCSLSHYLYLSGHKALLGQTSPFVKPWSRNSLTGLRSRNQGSNGKCPPCPIHHQGMVSFSNCIISQ